MQVTSSFSVPRKSQRTCILYDTLVFLQPAVDTKNACQSRSQIIGLDAALFLTNVGNCLASTDVFWKFEELRFN
jgi:hypothetical protein